MQTACPMLFTVSSGVKEQYRYIGKYSLWLIKMHVSQLLKPSFHEASGCSVTSGRAGTVAKPQVAVAEGRCCFVAQWVAEQKICVRGRGEGGEAWPSDKRRIQSHGFFKP